MAIYLAARDLSGVPVGTHQFLIINKLSTPYISARLGDQVIKPRDLGNGSLGYVVGAQNRGNLSVEYFEKNDYQAALEFYDKSRISFFQSDFDTEVKQVKFQNINEAVATRKILNLIDIYHINQTMDRIKYPLAGIGINSNSWAQTLIDVVGGRVAGDMSGFDISNKKRIPKVYFSPVCLDRPRPLVN